MTSAEVLLQFLDEQVGFLLGLPDPEFLRELLPFHRTLEGEPRLRAALNDMRDEFFKLAQEHQQYDEATVQELNALRPELVQNGPAGSDDSGAPQPEHLGPGDSYNWTLANFDRIASGGRITPWQSRDGDRTRSGALLAILEERVQHARFPDRTRENKEDQCPGLRGLADKLFNLRQKHDRAVRRFHWNRLTSPGVELVTVEQHLREMDPEPVLLPIGDDAARDEALRAYFESMFREVAQYGKNKQVVREVLTTDKPPSEEQLKKIKAPADALRLAVKRVQADIRRRVMLGRSLRSLFYRFKQRCEWYDRGRLYELAERNPGRPEEVLARELVLWLFDQGLSPVTKPTLGLQPDVIDPSVESNLYVEVKQYKTANRSYVIKGARQVWETAHQMRGTPYESMEAFYVVFSRGGPLYEFPSQVTGQHGTWTMHPIMIDIAPREVRGSRTQQPPERISTADLLPGLEEPTGPSDPASSAVPRKRSAPAGRKRRNSPRAARSRGSGSSQRKPGRR